MPSLYDELTRAAKAPVVREAIRIDRSNLDTYAKCSYWARAELLGEIHERYLKTLNEDTKLDYSDLWWLKKFGIKSGRWVPVEYYKVPDFDSDRPANVGIEFHGVMNGYIDELLDTGESRNPDALCALAIAADARYQPELLHCAKLTGSRISVWAPSYIAHEKQMSYTLPRFGPAGEDVALSCRPDLVVQGYGPKEKRIIDWKTGWGRDFGLQPMFYSVVAWRYLADIEQITWQPFFCRKGSWGKPYEYKLEDLEDNENIIKSAVGQMLTEEEWAPQPGIERCRYCPLKESCGAEMRYAEIDKDRVAFAGATEKLQAQVADRIKVLKSDVAAHGPIQTDGGWWGTNIINQRPSFKRNRGDPGYLGEDDDDSSKDADNGNGSE